MFEEMIRTRPSRQIDFDHFTAFIETGIDPINRVIHLSDELDRDDSSREESAARIVRGLFFMDSCSDDPITFYLDTPGGSEFKMFAIYDAMLSCRSPIITVAIGAVQSAGGLLLAAGDERYACENSYFMAHHGQTGMNGNFSTGEIKAHSSLLIQMERQWASLMERHTKRDADWWTEELNRRSEVWLTPKEMLDLGIVDGVFSISDAKEDKNVGNTGTEIDPT